MIASLRSEFRKLFTVRSTYFLLLIVFAIEIFFAFWATGYKARPVDLIQSNYLASQVTNAITSLALLLSVVGILLVTHEYRYNTITYTLTAARKRSTVLLSKTLVVSLFSLILGVMLGFLSPLLTILGVHVVGHHLVPQTFPVWDLLWRTMFYGWGFAMFALILAFIIRVQVGAIVVIFLIPSTIERLIGLLLGNNVVYLPFSSLASVVTTVGAKPISPSRAALVALSYLVVGWIIAWVFFMRRDAN